MKHLKKEKELCLLATEFKKILYSQDINNKRYNRRFNWQKRRQKFSHFITKHTKDMQEKLM